MIIKHEGIPGAKLNFKISAIIEGLWFGLAFLLIPGFLYQLSFAAEPTAAEIFFLRTIGMLALALAIGCWYARTADRSAVRLMSMLMVIAKGGTTILLVLLLLAGLAQPIGWINPVLTAFLTVLNAWQFLLSR